MEMNVSRRAAVSLCLRLGNGVIHSPGMMSLPLPEVPVRRSARAMCPGDRMMMAVLMMMAVMLVVYSVHHVHDDPHDYVRGRCS